MFFVIPTGRRYTATVKGTTTKTVKCEKCEKTYAYQYDAQASGTSSSPLFLKNEQAKKEAEEKARANLEQFIRDTAMPYPCPSCGYYQSNMIEPYRLTTYRKLAYFTKKWLLFWFFGWIGVILLAALVGGLLHASGLTADPYTIVGPVGGIYFVCFPVVAIGAKAWLTFARKQVNPNLGRS